MKKFTPRNNFWIRFTAFFLTVFVCIALALNAVAIAYMAERGYYIDNGVSDREDIKSEAAYNYSVIAANEYSQENQDDVTYVFNYYYQHYYALQFLNLNNVHYSIVDKESGTELFSNVDKSVGNLYAKEYTNHIEVQYVKETDPYSYNTILSDEYSVTCYLRSTPPYTDAYTQMMALTNFLSIAKYPLIASAAVLLIGFIALFIFLIRSAGLDSDGKPTPGFLGKVPIEIFAVIISLGLVLSTAGGIALIDVGSLGLEILAYVLILLGWLVFCVWLFMGLAARFRSGTFLKYCLTWMILRLIGKICRWWWQIYHKAGFLWRSLIAIVVVSFVLLISLILAFSNDAILLLFFIYFVLVSVFSVACANLAKLKKAIERLAAGDYTTKVSTVGMLFDFRRAAQNINKTGDGMSKAVEERTKSEHLKTELITNVSHDIKTPLTSIVNCVDLMKNSGEDFSEQTAEYLDILDRQSRRLKKLTEDVLEASKASTGNINVNLEPVDMGLLLSQALGEYSDKFEEKNLKAVVNISGENIMAHADGRLLWRVFDNLCSNIVKYSLPGTRVYLDTVTAGGLVFATFRNISEYELPPSTEELTERFIRGDASRHTEGSGLGLSIAGDLCSLMGGKLMLSTEADLFKATVSLPACQLVPKNSEAK